MKAIQFLFIICYIGISISLQAQSIITGRVTTLKGEAVEYARVLVLIPKDSTIVTYAFTDANGAYKLSVNSPVAELILSASSMEIERTDKRVPNKSQTCNFSVREARTMLKEVQVKAHKIWGQKDTVNYSVGSFVGKNDVVIADVLKKMPGIEVDLSGLIKYKGMAINKFYIEGMDALQGRYGIATNNISAKDVATVQVLENHQPIKALEKTSPSDRAAINLKLKSEVKGTLSMTAQLGLGYDDKFRRNEELTAMYFAKHKQHIVTAKSNDNGQDISNELRSFTASSVLPDLSMASLQYPHAPNILRSRYYYNDTHALTANNLFKVKNEAELNANLILYYDKERQEGGTQTSYHLPNGSEVISEDLNTLSKMTQLEGELRYNINKDKLYFNNLLDVKARWDRETGGVQSIEPIEQAMKYQLLRINNTSHWVKNGEDGRGWNVFWRNAFATEPHRLHIKPGIYAPRLNNNEAYAELSQDVRHKAYASFAEIARTSALRVAGISINPTLFLQAQHQDMVSELGLTDLTGRYKPVEGRDMNNSIAFTRLSAGLGIEATRKSDKIQLSLVMPLFYRHTKMQDALRRGEGINEGKLYVEPSAWIKYNLTPELDIKLNGSISQSQLGLNSLYSGYIMSNYRNLSRNEMKQYNMTSVNTGLSLSYKDIFSMLFVGGGLSYRHYRSESIGSTKIEAPLTLVERLPLPHTGHNVSANARISKGFDWLSLNLSSDISAGQGSGKSYIQGSLLGYESQALSLSGKCTMKPFEWLTAEYNIAWSLYRNRQESRPWLTPVRSMSHTLTGHLNIVKDLAIRFAGEHYFNSAVSSGNNFTLADLGLVYTYKKIRFSLDWTNIFNTKVYTTASINNLVATHSYYNIRPQAIMLKARFKLL